MLKSSWQEKRILKLTNDALAGGRAKISASLNKIRSENLQLKRIRWKSQKVTLVLFLLTTGLRDRVANQPLKQILSRIHQSSPAPI